METGGWSMTTTARNWGIFQGTYSQYQAPVLLLRLTGGGETYSPTNACPPIDSGHFPDEGVRKASFMSGIKVMNQTRQPVDAPLNTGTITDVPQNYRVLDRDERGYSCPFIHRKTKKKKGIPSHV